MLCASTRSSCVLTRPNIGDLFLSCPSSHMSLPPRERIIVDTVANPDEHLPKATRTLSTFVMCWGGCLAGYYAGGGEKGLEEHEVRDGLSPSWSQ